MLVEEGAFMGFCGYKKGPFRHKPNRLILPRGEVSLAMTLGRACDHTDSRRGLWDEERGRKWAGRRRVVPAVLLVPSVNGELQRPPTEPQAKGLYLPCLSVLPCHGVPCV